MNPWHDIAIDRINSDRFISVIEIPKGCKKKYELDKDSGILILDRVLFTSTHYPANYGFIPKTLSDDGDPMDVLVLCQECLDPLTLVNCYPIGVIKMIDNREVDEKIIAIPFGDPSLNTYQTISALPKHMFLEIRHFFEVYKNLEEKPTMVEQISGREEAERVIRESIENYQRAFPETIEK